MTGCPETMAYGASDERSSHWVDSSFFPSRSGSFTDQSVSFVLCVTEIPGL